MTHFQGFKTKNEAKEYQRDHGGMLCYEKSQAEKRGKNAEYYRMAVVCGGLSREYPYCVQWNE